MEEVSIEDVDLDTTTKDSRESLDDILLLPDSEPIDDSSLDPEGRLLLNPGHPKEDMDIYVVKHLASTMTPYQVSGVRFMYRCLVGTLVHLRKASGGGCILAHAMGLGKTLQCIAFVDSLLRVKVLFRVLVVLPLNVIENWRSEFNTWVPDGVTENLPRNITARSYQVLALSEGLRDVEHKATVIGKWWKHGGVLLISYEMFRSLVTGVPGASDHQTHLRMSGTEAAPPAENTEHLMTGHSSLPAYNINNRGDSASFEKTLKERVKQALSNPGPDILVCDEGHRIKNFLSDTTQSLNTVRTSRRLVLTGYPVQNDLLEYWAMLRFVRPCALSSRKQFDALFSHPISHGQLLDSTAEERRLMRCRAFVLKDTVEGFVQRQNDDFLKKNLPPKYEFIIPVNLTELQRELYAELTTELDLGSASVIVAYQLLFKIWNHPDLLYNRLQQLQVEDGDENLDGAPEDDAAMNHAGSAVQSGSPSVCSTTSKRKLQDVYERHHYAPGLAENSAKTQILLEIVKECVLMGDKVLVFSQSVLTLDIICGILHQTCLPTCLAGKVPSTCWKKNESYFRLDGFTTAAERSTILQRFDSPDNHTVFLFLVSTRAGCLGINMTAANRVVLFDVCWNPCHDIQAISRVYRLGQRRPSYIYRLVAFGTLEKRLYNRQVNKQRLSGRVLDEMNPSITFSKMDVCLPSTFMLQEDDPAKSWDQTIGCTDLDPVLAHLKTRIKHLMFAAPCLHEDYLSSHAKSSLSLAQRKLALSEYERDKRNQEDKNPDLDWPLDGTFVRRPRSFARFHNTRTRPAPARPSRVRCPEEHRSTKPSRAPSPNGERVMIENDDVLVTVRRSTGSVSKLRCYSRPQRSPTTLTNCDLSASSVSSPFTSSDPSGSFPRSVAVVGGRSRALLEAVITLVREGGLRFSLNQPSDSLENRRMNICQSS